MHEPTGESRDSAVVGQAGLLHKDRRLLVLALLVLGAVAALTGANLRKALREDSNFRIYYAAGTAVLEGDDPYVTPSERAYVYPPIFALLFAPLSSLPVGPAAALWLALTVIGWGLCIVNVYRLLDARAPPLHPLWLILPVLVAARPFLHNLNYSQASLFLVFPAYYGLVLLKRRRDLSGGLIFSLSLAVKFFPVLVVVFLAWKRQFRFVAGVIVGTVLWYGAVPSLVFGPQRNVELLGEWVDVVSSFQASDSLETHALFLNQSLRGGLNRLFLWISQQEGAASAQTLLAIRTATHAALALLLLVGTTLALRRRDVRRGDQLALTASLAYLLIPFITGTGWKHHFVVLLLPFALAFHLWGRGLLRRWQQVGIVAAAVLCNGSPGLLGKHLARTLQEYSVLLVGVSILLIVLWFAPRQESARATE